MARVQHQRVHEWLPETRIPQLYSEFVVLLGLCRYNLRLNAPDFLRRFAGTYDRGPIRCTYATLPSVREALVLDTCVLRSYTYCRTARRICCAIG